MTILNEMFNYLGIGFTVFFLVSIYLIILHLIIVWHQYRRFNKGNSMRALEETAFPWLAPYLERIETIPIAAIDHLGEAMLHEFDLRVFSHLELVDIYADKIVRAGLIGTMLGFLEAFQYLKAPGLSPSQVFASFSDHGAGLALLSSVVALCIAGIIPRLKYPLETMRDKTERAIALFKVEIVVDKTKKTSLSVAKNDPSPFLSVQQSSN